MSYSYEIKPRPDELGGGWKLSLLQDGQDVGGGMFPVPEDNPQAGMTWWNNLAENQRAHWLMMAASAMPTAARHAYLVAEAYNDARDEAEAWMSTRMQ
jgi:hypothetical protein